MTRIAKEDFFATEDLGDGMEVRRMVKAGTEVPLHWEVDEDKVTDTDGPAATGPVADAGKPADTPPIEDLHEADENVEPTEVDEKPRSARGRKG